MELVSTQDRTSYQEKINQLQYRKQIEDFNTNLEKGDLGLAMRILYGFAVYGDTRAGKTALCHILSGNSLKGMKINGEFMVVCTTTKNKKAKIGNTMNSQTLVPNNFSVVLEKGKLKCSLIDTPGYGDTNGTLTIMANSFYHYRLYSKVQNMKFILCFDIIQLQNTCIDFIKALVNWASSFKDYYTHPNVRKNIWESVAIVITKVEDKPTIKQDLLTKLRSIAQNINTNHEPQIKSAVRQMIYFLIKEDRIFHVRKIKEGETFVQGDLLEKIDGKISNWWIRDFDEQNQEVDMKPVCFALSQQILQSTTSFPACRRQFIELITYYNLRLKEFVKSATSNDAQNFSLAVAIQKLVDDAMSNPDSHQFIDVMNNYIKLYYDKYDKTYSEERQKREQELFSIKNDNAGSTQKSRQQFRGKDKNYLVKKFRCLQEIEELKNQINSIELDQRDIKSIEVCAHNVYEIIKEFNKIAFRRNLASQVIYKYGYLIHRIIEEAKIFTLLLEIYGVADRMKLMEQANGQFIQILRVLIDFMGVPFRYNRRQVTYDQLHLEFIKKFNFIDETYKLLLINEDLVTFFTHVQIHDEDDIDKQIQVVIMYSDKVLEDSQKMANLILTKEIGKLIRKLTGVRINCQASYQLKKSPQQKNYYMFTIRKTTKNLGKLLQLLGQYRLSRQVYSTINFVDSVCKLYHAELGLLRKANLNDSANRGRQFDLRIEFSQYLSTHFRQYEAIQVLQESFELAEDTNELKRVKEKLTKLKLIMKESPSSEYQKKLFNEQFFDAFEDTLEKEIIDYTKSAGDAS